MARPTLATHPHKVIFASKVRELLCIRHNSHCVFSENLRPFGGGARQGFVQPPAARRAGGAGEAKTRALQCNESSRRRTCRFTTVCNSPASTL